MDEFALFWHFRMTWPQLLTFVPQEIAPEGPGYIKTENRIRALRCTENVKNSKFFAVTY